MTSTKKAPGVIHVFTFGSRSPLSVRSARAKATSTINGGATPTSWIPTMTLLRTPAMSRYHSAKAATW